MDERSEFLRTWYGVLWSNIDRSMTSIWQIVGPIGLVGAAFLYIDKFGPHLTASMQLIIIFWALNNTIDMNAWHRRNLVFAARVERNFLKEADYGVVIPRSFREPKTDWIEFYTINLITFAMLMGLVIAVYIAKVLRAPQSMLYSILGPAILLVIGLIATVYTYRRCEKQIARYKDETQGTIPQL